MREGKTLRAHIFQVAVLALIHKSSDHKIPTVTRVAVEGPPLYSNASVCNDDSREIFAANMRF